MQKDMLNVKEMELDVSKVILKIFKYRKTFMSMLLLCFFAGLAIIQFSQKIYSSSITIQAPSYGLASNEVAVNIKDLVINGFFNEELMKKIDLSLQNDKIQFIAKVPLNINMLIISINLGEEKKVWASGILLKLTDLIDKHYEEKVTSSLNTISIEIAQKEAALLLGKQKINNLDEKKKAIDEREIRLKDELRLINENINQILALREKIFKDYEPKEGMSEGVEAMIVLANFLQPNLAYLNTVNYQLRELPLSRADFDINIKEIEYNLNQIPLEIAKLNIVKSDISNIRIISKPETSINPVLPNKKKILLKSIIIGLFLGFTGVFLQEFWHKRRKNV
ncbi:MAG: hypothetical protein KKD05_02475 [Candidatus Omnitrophica bacterium]|nr:hypothetical protein [Candidatus Omnitrophota bacterium]